MTPPGTATGGASAATAPDLAEPGLLAERIETALLAERVRLYAKSVNSAIAGQTIVAVLVLAVLWPGTALAPILVFLVLLGLSFGVRLWAAAPLRGDAPAPPSAGLMRRLRAAVLVSAAIWGLAGWLLFPADDLQAQTFIVFVVAGLAAGSLTLTAFDLRAALGFVALSVLPLSVRLLLAGTPEAAAMAAMALVFVSFLALNGRRAERNVRDGVAARVADALRAEALLRNHQRLEQISAELARQSSALQATLDNMDQGILSLGADGRTSFFNRRLTALTGLPESLLQQRPTMADIAQHQHDHGHFGPDFELVDEAGREPLRRWFAGEKVEFPDTYLRRTPDGRTLEVKSHYLPGGGLVRTFTDVSAYVDAQQRLHDSQAQLRKLALVAAHTDNAVAILDADRRIEWVNEGFSRMTGYPLEDAVGRFPVHLLHAEGLDIEAVARLDEALLREGRCAGELLQRARDGHTYWCALEVQAIADERGRVSQYVSISRDISARKAADEALRAARDEAERASRAKSDFLSAMSHELRTPMNAILGFAQLLDTDRAQPLSPRQHEQVQQILRAGSHLLSLINDVLDLARVEAGEQAISLEPVDLGEVFDECVALMRPLADARAIELRVERGEPAGPEAPRYVRADRTRLKQVLLNLMSNAVKYNREGGHVGLRAAIAADEWRLGVSDTGPGLGEAERERLFRPFERLGAEGGPVEGAGIGLALSRRIVELMHGRIEVESRPGEGSVFWVCLPSAAAPAHGLAEERESNAVAAPPIPPGDAAEQPPVPPGAERAVPLRRVLYIEDNPVNIMLMEAMLEREPGVRLGTAPLPELGLAMAQADPPDLILLDIQLPGIDGFEVLRRLRAQPRTEAVPVIAVSANAMPDDVARALGAGFDGYLTKPLEIERLLQTVRATWGRRPVGAAAAGDTAAGGR